MDTQTKAKLRQINQAFYDQFASSFSTTRHQVQPGVRRVSQMVPKDAAILDVGCGNGTLARLLADQGFSGTYLGVDLSEGLLADASRLLASPPDGTYAFQRVDLADPHWAASLLHQTADWLVAFAVLHHLPGADLRLQTVKSFRKLIAPDGSVVVSVWQWQNSPRLQKRVLPWSIVDLDPENLDQGDVLLDWRADQVPGLRYVHTLSEASLRKLAEGAGFRVIESFYSDGKTGNLALYQVWKIK